MMYDGPEARHVDCTQVLCKRFVYATVVALGSDSGLRRWHSIGSMRVAIQQRQHPSNLRGQYVPVVSLSLSWRCAAVTVQNLMDYGSRRLLSTEDLI